MIRDVHHVGIAVRSLDQALALYRDALGLEVVKEGDVPSRGARVAMLAVGRSHLEIIEPMGDGGPFAEFLSERGEGLHHVGLWTDDVDAQVGALRDAGAALEDHEPREGFTGRLAFLAASAFDGVQMEVVQPDQQQVTSNKQQERSAGSRVTRIDHVVLRVPNASATCERFQSWFGVKTKRTFERGPMTFGFLKPGEVILEVIGPTAGDGDPGSGRIAGLAFEVKGIDALAEALREKGYPVGEPHAALQGGRIVSVHHSGACGAPVAFIDFG